MSKKISFIKKFNKLLLSVNARIESFFNSIKDLINSIKKTKFNLKNPNQKIILAISLFFILILSYFLIPTFYDQEIIKKRIKDQILEKYNLEVKFNDSLIYNLFPKPHFSSGESFIQHNDRRLAEIKLTKIFITNNNFFSVDNLRIKDILFKQTEFNINSKNFDFFEKILNSNKSEDVINFKKSKLFYKDQNGDVIFLTNIKDMSSIYNEEFNQQLNANLEIFNVPLKIKIINNLSKKNILFSINSHNLRLNIKNELRYDKKKPKGSIEFKAINKSKKLDYVLDKNSLNFESEEESFNGKLDFKPFYLSANLKFHQLDLNKLLQSNSIFLDLVNTKLLNNQSLNAVMNIKFDKIKNFNYLKDISLKAYFEEGNIFIKNSSLNWKNSVMIDLENVQLMSENNSIIFSGSVKFNFENIEDFYRQYQIKKIYRANIKKIKLDFLLNLNKNEIEIDNLKIDASSNKTANDYINKFNSKKKNIFNKVIFKNSIKEFFENL
tara:strand:- start:1362 stop:2846 length:1485 start_codon:yes stop_codon:yes gene_type:complete